MNKISHHRLACIVFAIIMGIFGITHLISAEKMKDTVPSWLPGGVIWVYVTGIGFVLASVAILINKQAKLACYLLAAMLLIFIFTIHVPAIVSGKDEAAKQMGMLLMLKDVGLTMAAVLVGYNSDRADDEPND
jgi:putative oxidoreductase